MVFTCSLGIFSKLTFQMYPLGGFVMWSLSCFWEKYMYMHMYMNKIGIRYSGTCLINHVLVAEFACPMLVRALACTCY